MLRFYSSMFIFFLLFIILSSCAKTTTKSIPKDSFSLVPMTYEIVGQSTGEASGEFLFWGTVNLKATSTTELGVLNAGASVAGTTFNIFEALGIGAGMDFHLAKAKAMALYRALGKLPNADSVIEPIWETESEDILGGLYTKVIVRVKVKGIKYNGPAPIK